MKTPAGNIFFKQQNGKLTYLGWGNEQSDSFSKFEQELTDYFAGKIKKFKTPLEFNTGTEFQKKVWQALCSIPYGETVTYTDLAKKLNTHPRAIGGAVGKNPIPIVVPCHRVVGKNGSLVGFSGGEGVKTKQILLQIEKASK